MASFFRNLFKIFSQRKILHFHSKFTEIYKGSIGDQFALGQLMATWTNGARELYLIGGAFRIEEILVIHEFVNIKIHHMAKITNAICILEYSLISYTPRMTENCL